MRPATLALTVSLVTLAACTGILRAWLGESNAAIVSTTYLLVVLVTAAVTRLWVAIVTSVAAMLCLNFFFLPPVGTWTIADPLNWVALFAFLAVSLIASHLSAVARTRTDEATARGHELARLFDLGRDVLLMPVGPGGLTFLATCVARRFDLDFIAVAQPRAGGWQVHDAGRVSLALDDRELTNAMASAQAAIEFDARTRTYAGHRTTVVDGRTVRLVPLRVGTTPVGVLAAAGRPVEPGTLDTLAGVLAIAIERAALLEEREAAELTRQSERLKTTLLASLGHDLRTPLTAIRLAASNIRMGELDAEGTTEQSDVILAETARLTRLFEDLLEMARIDAGAVAAESRWTHPSEIVAAARAQVAPALQAHVVDAQVDEDTPVWLDPRLTATALARLLENAAQYSPPGTTVRVTAGIEAARDLVLEVADQGPGIDPADLPHVFERFYRGRAAQARTSGTGMGLWIVRGLLATQQGRVWAANGAELGARFTMQVPVRVKQSDVVETSS